MVRLTGACFTGECFTGECFTIVRFTGVHFTGGAFGPLGDLAGVGGGAAAGSCGPKIRFLNSLRNRTASGNDRLYCRSWHDSSIFAFLDDGGVGFFFLGA